VGVDVICEKTTTLIFLGLGLFFPLLRSCFAMEMRSASCFVGVVSKEKDQRKRGFFALKG
jgi:hypothetical protein